jgi:hypothetical protein
MSSHDDKINLAIWNVLRHPNCFEKIEKIQLEHNNIIYVIPVRLLSEAKSGSDGLYFVHAPENQNDESRPVYSTAYVLPNNPHIPKDNYTNINYIDVPVQHRKKGIASKLLEAIKN